MVEDCLPRQQVIVVWKDTGDPNDAVLSWRSTGQKQVKQQLDNFLNNEEATFEYITEDELRELDLAIYERDEDIPEFKKLQNFPVAISVAKKVDDNTFLITGTLNLTEDEYIYKLEKGEELTFEDIEVTQDEDDEENDDDNDAEFDDDE